MYSLVASCFIASLAATTGPLHAAEAFTPHKPASPAGASGNPGRPRSTAKNPSESGCSVGESSSSKALGVSAVPLDVSIEEEESSFSSSRRPRRPAHPTDISSLYSSTSPLTDDDIERQLQSHLIKIHSSSGRKRASSAAASRKKRRSVTGNVGGGGSGGGMGSNAPRILHHGPDGVVGTIRVVDAPEAAGRRRRSIVTGGGRGDGGGERKVTIGDAPLSKTSSSSSAAAKKKSSLPLRLTREEEAQISSDVRSLRSAVLARDDLASSLGREPSEREWADSLEEGGGRGRASASVLDLRRIMRDGREARSRLVAANAGLVASMARKYSAAVRSSSRAGGSGGIGSILTVQDLIQEGNLGLMEAAGRFEPERGFRFSTYASHWVRQRMLRSIADYSRVIRLPAHVHSKLGTLRRARTDLTKDLGRPPTDSELASRLDLPVDKVRLYAASDRNVLSLEAPANGASHNLDDRRRALGDLIASNSPTPEEDALSQSLRRDIRAAVDGCLTDRERDVLVLRFGLEDGAPRSVGDAARELGLSRDRVRTVEARALNKLRHPRRNHRLKEYVNGGAEGRGVAEEAEEDFFASGPAAAATPSDCVVGSSPESLWSF
mmetsp:Transcript_43331/g.131831  ORF Transcript_43331/g.131831 Transcript_43331/m.131831 type:complete len:608 (-) Transcript_43331:605-2428(-)